MPARHDARMESLPDRLPLAPAPSRFAPAASGRRPAAVRLVGAGLASPWALVLAVLLAFWLNCGTLPLTDVDEGAFSEATREMLARGNLVSPTLNGLPRHDKPILIYWAQAASVSLFGLNEFAFRLPSLLASLLWLAALYRFCLRHADRATAQVAGLVMVLSLQVGLIAKAAIADALLNLFIAVALFWIYDHFAALRDGRGDPARWRLPAIYAALGLGFLTKGPVAVLFPLLAGGLFFVSAGAWRGALRVLGCWPGWLVFLAVVLPWHALVYLDQGDAFFRGFYLQHNLNRYASTFEGHGGNPLYYVAALPLVLLPFTGWLLAIVGPLGRSLRGRTAEAGLGRFLLIWFGVVFVFFSLSRTQLPHYLLYGCTPLFVLLARHRELDGRRGLAFAPVLLLAALLAALPTLLEWAAGRPQKPLESLLLQGFSDAFAGPAGWGLGLAAAVLLGLALWRRLPVWQGLVLAGLVQAAVGFGLVMPRLLDVTQGPVKEAAQLAAAGPGPVVSWRLNQPSFSVYRRAATPSRLPQAGERVLTRSDRLPELQAALQTGGPASLHPLYRRGHVALVRVDRPEQP